MRRIKIEHLAVNRYYTLIEWGVNRVFQYLGDSNILIFEPYGGTFKTFLLGDELIVTPGSAKEALDYDSDVQFYEEYNQNQDIYIRPKFIKL